MGQATQPHCRTCLRFTPTCSASRSWISRVLCISSCCCLRRCSSSCSSISACRWASFSSSNSCSFRSFSSWSCLSRCVSSSLAALRCSRCSRCSRRFCFRSLCRDFLPSACSRMAVWMAAEGKGGCQEGCEMLGTGHRVGMVYKPSVHSWRCRVSEALISYVRDEVFTQNMHLFPSRSGSTYRERTWDGIISMWMGDNRWDENQEKPPDTCGRCCSCCEPSLYLHTAVPVQGNAPLLFLPLLTHVVGQGTGLQHEPPLRPVPPQLALLPEVALHPEDTGFKNDVGAGWVFA